MNSKPNSTMGTLPSMAHKFPKTRLYKLNYACSLQESRPRRQFWRVPCKGCNQFVNRTDAIQGNVVKAFGGVWHGEHLRCCQCGASVMKPAPRDFRETDDKKPLCIDCFTENTHPKCAGCNVVLRESCIEGMGQKWHRDCFVCHTCRSPMPGGEYLIFEGKPYDEDCFFDKKYEGIIEVTTEQLAITSVFGFKDVIWK